jgi:hypothetical protein
MFFELPAYPQRDFISMLPEGTEIKTEVVVTNDGRHYSGPLEFIYYAGMVILSFVVSLGTNC